MIVNRIIQVLLAVIAIELGVLLLRPLVTPAFAQNGGQTGSQQAAITTVAVDDGHIEILVVSNGYLSEWVSVRDEVNHSSTDQEWQAAMNSGKLVMLDAKRLPPATK